MDELSYLLTFVTDIVSTFPTWHTEMVSDRTR